MTLEELEKEYLLKVLDETGWHKKRAASILGINASTLYRKLQRYRCDRPDEYANPDRQLVESAKSD